MSDPNQPTGSQRPPNQGGPYSAARPQPYGLPEHPQGTTILVLAIAGFFVTVCAPIAWYLGSQAQKQIAATGQHYSNEQTINIGKIIGMVLSILALASIVLMIVVLILMVAGFSVFGLTRG